MASSTKRRAHGNRAHTTAILFLIFSIGLLGVVVYTILKAPGSRYDQSDSNTSQAKAKREEIVAFSSEQDFQKYLTTADEAYHGTGSIGSLAILQNKIATDEAVDFSGALTAENNVPERVSSTNVQFEGIDEPDIVKTDGTHLYTSRQPLYLKQLMEGKIFDTTDILMPRQPAPVTHILRAFPPEKLAKQSSINDAGELLLIKNTLILLGHDKLTGYEVSNPALPVESWAINFDGRHSLHAARLFGDTIYVVMKAQIHRPRPCPYIPLTLKGGSPAVTVRCADVYHPVVPVPVDSTYTVSSINASTGQITDTVSFVGAADTSIVSMSPSAVYITYTYARPFADIFTEFFSEEGQGLLPDIFRARIARVQGYELSSTAKYVEIEKILEEYQATLDKDDRRRMETDLLNQLQNYMKRHSHDMETTGIVRVSRLDLTVRETGSVPGHPLNQFSLDEYEGNVRIATTVGNTFFGNRQDSTSDVYVLDSKLRIAGAVRDLGLGERIYAVRFVRDTGYVVTFRETDPFYVLDLSRPNKPKLAGELKIPGYSSYLHPITEKLILGVGKEGQNVKLSLFDVSNASAPREADKYLLDESWSDVLNTHHAFLLDPKHRVFFVPGSQGGYIFSYANNTLILEKAVDSAQAKRAVFIDDYLYIVGEREIVVLDETNWERAGELNL